MKRITITLLFIIICFLSFSQSQNIGKFDRVQIKTPPTGTGTDIPVVWDADKKELKIYNYQGGGSGEIDSVPGGEITTIPQIGDNPGENIRVSDWIMNAFYGFVPATISLGSNALYEVGSSNTKTLSFSITTNGETIFTSGHIDRLTPTPQTIVKSWGSGSSSQSVQVTFNPIQGNSDSLQKTFRAYELVGGNGTPTTLTSSIVTLSSCYPYFYGMSEDDLSSGGSNFYNAFQSTRIVKICASTTSITYNSSTNKYAYFAFPATCNSITKIEDQNGYDWTEAFTEYPVNVTSPGKWTNQSYKIYKSNNTFSTLGNNWTFIFTQ